MEPEHGETMTVEAIEWPFLKAQKEGGDPSKLYELDGVECANPTPRSRRAQRFMRRAARSTRLLGAAPLPRGAIIHTGAVPRGTYHTVAPRSARPR